MANRTVRDAHSIRGKNPQNLVEKIIRNRVYECQYWKEECFGLNCALLVDKACELRAVGGVVGDTMNPTAFLNLVLKLLQLQPEKYIVIEFIKRSEFKYARALGAMYLRLTGDSAEIYKYLEPLYNDYRKLRVQGKDGVYKVIYMDEFIDSLLMDDYICSIILPRIQKRRHLEAQGLLEPRISVLDAEIQDSVLQEIERDAEREREKRRQEEEAEALKKEKLNGLAEEKDEHNERRRRRSRSRSKERRSLSPNRHSPRRDHRKRDKYEKSISPDIKRSKRNKSKSPRRHRDRSDSTEVRKRVKSKSPRRRRSKDRSVSPDKKRRRERSPSQDRKRRNRSVTPDRKRNKHRDSPDPSDKRRDNRRDYY